LTTGRVSTDRFALFRARCQVLTELDASARQVRAIDLESLNP